MAARTGHRGLVGALCRHPVVGIVGTAAGVAAAGTAAGLAVTRRLRRRASVQLGEAGLEAAAARLREEDPLGLAAREADRSTIVLTDDGVQLAVEEIGPLDAPVTVVFVHGYTLSMASWTFQRRSLAEQLATANGHRPAARLVFYDQRGHGASGRGAPANSTIEQLARDLDTVLTARVPRGPVVLVGHSMGGMTIMGFAARRPELFGSRIVGAALLSTSSGNLAELDFGLPEALTRVRAAIIPLAAYTMRQRPMLAERTRRAVSQVVSAATRSLAFASADVHPELGRYMDAMIAGTPVAVIGEFYPAIAGLDETGSLDPLRRVPTLVLTGEQDRLIPKAHSELIVERLPESEFVVVPDAGHMVLLEKPEIVTEALTRLIRRVAAERPARQRAR